MGSVAHARRNPDDGFTDQSSNDARQSRFHAGHHNHDIGRLDFGQPPQQPVQTGHAHVVNPLDGVAHEVGSDRRLFGHRKIGGSGRHDGNGSRALGQRRGFQGQAPGRLMVDRVAELLLQRPSLLRIHSSGQNASVGGKDF